MPVTSGTTTRYNQRVVFWVVALALALVASLMLTCGSVLGFLSIDQFNSNAWYGLTVAVCLLAAALALAGAQQLPVTMVARGVVLAASAAMIVLGFFLGASLLAVIQVAVFLVVVGVQFVRPAAAA